MIRCTVMGYGKYPALPNAELNLLKKRISRQFPGKNQIQFESTWKDVVNAIGQSCKRLRCEKERSNPVLID